MRHNHVRTAFHSFIHKFGSTVQAYQHRGNLSFGRAYGQTAVVPLFLQGKRGEILYHPDNILYLVHCIIFNV